MQIFQTCALPRISLKQASNISYTKPYQIHSPKTRSVIQLQPRVGYRLKIVKLKDSLFHAGKKKSLR